MAYAALYVFREVVHVILGLAEGDRQHELTLWRRVKPERGKLQFQNLACVHQIDQFSAVNTIPREAVRVPGHYAVGRALLKASDHLVEYGAARLLGGFAFDELAGYGETVLFSVVAEFSELRLYGKDLPVRLVRGLARVKEIPHIRLLHTLPPLALKAGFAQQG
ncbi:MAG: hypothetical protein A2X31_05355 [Elusimicrobia bacterium GWB2_63_22]|nr:MAG: hypothetical protein A2X31_05355 [Elusimicrobia bacterium GWB2_63_22]